MGARVKENQVNHMRLPLFGEWKKLDLLPRYSTRAGAKMVQDCNNFHQINFSAPKIGPDLHPIHNCIYQIFDAP